MFAFLEKLLRPVQLVYSNAEGGSIPSSIMKMTNRPTIDADRRRRDEGGPSGRAEAPQRQRPGSTPATPRPTSSGSGGGYSSGGGGGYSSGGGGGGFQLPTNLNIPKLPWWMWAIILVGGAIFIFFILPNMGGLDTGTYQTDNTNNTGYQQTEPTLTLEPFVAPTAVTGKGQTWTVMLYMDADDEILEQDIFIDFNEIERIGSTDRVRIVVQLDRFRGGFSGDGDWSGTRRYYVTQDDDLNHIASQVVADLGEVNMSSGASLVDFVKWGAANFPADKYVLIMSDHGMGWPGGWVDPEPGGSGDPSIPLEQRLGNMLYLNNLDQALGQARSAAGIDKFELFGMDACLMSQVEVLTALAPHARYAVASEEVEPSLGWAYTAFLKKLVSNPDMGGAELAKSVVSTYIVDDQRIQDDQARQEFLRGQRATASQVSNELSKDITLTAIDLSKVSELDLALNDLAFALQSADERAVAQARSYAHSYTNVFSQTEPSAYIDLGNFAQFLQQGTNDSEVNRAANRVLQAVDATVIAEKHGPKQNGSTGVSIYFPNSSLYESPISGPQSYTKIATRFAQETLWDDFLAYHYTGRSFKADDAAVVVPDISAAFRAPGAGQITVSNLKVSNTTASPNNPVTISADISGSNIGYIYLFVGYYDQASNSVFVADTDYLESGDTRQVNGVYYPVWNNSGFTLSFEWDVSIFSISDGTNTYLTLFQPQSFGASFEDAVYTVDGTYTFSDTGKSQFARLSFSNGLMTHVYGYTGDGATGAPREISPTAGDTFTLKERWFDLNSSGKFETTTIVDGQTLTFSGQNFTWEQQYAPQGDYVIGFIVEDLNGKKTGSYTQLTVE